MNAEAPNDVDRQAVDSAVDEMLRVVEQAITKMVEVASLQGARRHAAAAMLRRAMELLRAARASDTGSATAPVVELAARSVFELTCRGRYLLDCDEDSDEFVRMSHDYLARETKLATAIGVKSPGLPLFLAEAIASKAAKRPRDLWSICEALDATEGRPVTDRYSARSSYHLMYGWFSNSATHAGLAALKRFVREEDGVLMMIPNPAPLTTSWPIPIMAGFIGELALAVLKAFDLPLQELQATQVALPSRPQP